MSVDLRNGTRKQLARGRIHGLRVESDGCCVSFLRHNDARPGEEKSYLIILKIDDDPKLGRIIHIAMRGLKMKNRRSPDGFSENVNHMPFLEEAIEKSGLKLLKEKVDLPDFEEGYKIWREAFDAGRAGAYSISVAEAVVVMETTLMR